MNFTQYFAWAKTAAKLLPIAVDVATAVQAAFPPDTNGAKKMDQVKTSLQTMLATQNMVTDEFEHVWPFVQPLLSSLIQGFKASGVNGFSASKSTPMPAVSTAPDAGEHIGN